MARVAGFFLPLVMVWDGAHQRRRLLKKIGLQRLMDKRK